MDAVITPILRLRKTRFRYLFVYFSHIQQCSGVTLRKMVRSCFWGAQGTMWCQRSNLGFAQAKHVVSTLNYQSSSIPRNLYLYHGLGLIPRGTWGLFPALCFPGHCQGYFPWDYVVPWIEPGPPAYKACAQCLSSFFGLQPEIIITEN